MRARVCLLTVLVALWPAFVQGADTGWWGWLEGLSGPGPFNKTGWVPFKTGWVADLRVACFATEDARDRDPRTGYVAPPVMSFLHKGSERDPYPCLFNSKSTTGSLQLRVMHRYTDDDQPVFRDTPNDLRQITANA